MPRLSPVNYKILIKVFEGQGWKVNPKGGKGSHIKMNKPGELRPIIFPAKKDIKVGTLSSCLRTAKLSNDQFLKLLNKI